MGIQSVEMALKIAWIYSPIFNSYVSVFYVRLEFSKCIPLGLANRKTYVK